jgi:hypothetical protein
MRISKGYTDSNSWVPDWASGMKKVLYANGCSHTAGTKLAMENRFDLTWPNLLAKNLDFNLINDSTPGASNDRIFRTTIEYILSTAIPPDKVVVQFTEFERFELAHSTCNPRSQTILEKYLPFLNDFFELNISKTDISLIYTHKLLNQIYSLENIFKEHAIDDYTFLIWRKVDQNYNTYKFINKNKIIFDVCLKLSQKYKTCQKPDPSRNNIPDGHFGQDAHYEIFEWLKYGKDWYGKIEKAEDISESAY